MATPHDAPYKKAQRDAEFKVKNGGRFLWVSCKLDKIWLPMVRKIPVQGTYARKLHGKLK